MIEESCSAADCRGLKGRRAFEKQLLDFRQWCNENHPDDDILNNDEDETSHTVDKTPNVNERKRKSTVVPMTLTKYTSGTERIHNTARMG